MTLDTDTMLQISASGMKVEGQRLKIIAQNLANAQTTGDKPGAQPYRRQMVVFKDVLDKETGAMEVQATGVAYDMSDFTKKFDPSHPAADANGYVLEPNVKPIIEMTDMREAERAYDADLSMVETTKSMESHTLDILKAV